MSPEELFKTCSQLAILKHNIPSKDKNITLTEDEIAQLAENYLKEIIMIFKWGFDDFFVTFLAYNLLFILTKEMIWSNKKF